GRDMYWRPSRRAWRVDRPRRRRPVGGADSRPGRAMSARPGHGLRAIAMLLVMLTAAPVAAQEFSDFATGAVNGISQNAVLLVVGLTLLSLAPALAIMVTCFPFIVTVLSILRQSIGLQQSPPNMLIVSLAMFLSWYVM